MDTWDNHASTGYAGGSGTYSDPYRIETAGQLAYLAKQSRTTTLTGYYSLENSVDMSEYLWLGIGSESVPFCGFFNGNLNAIKGIIMCVTDKFLGGCIGFFNNISSTSNDSITIYDIMLTDGIIVSTCSAVGCLIGKADVYIEGGVYPNLPNYNELDVWNCVVEDYTVMASGSISGIIESPNGSDFQYKEDDDYIDEYAFVYIANCMVRNCEFISTTSMDIGGIYCEGNYVNVNSCAVVDVTFVSGDTSGLSKFYPIGWYDIYIRYSYAKTTYINTATGTRERKKVLSDGVGNLWSYWFYNPSLNGGYPIQRSFLKIAPSITQTGAQVYNYLVSLGFSVSE